MKLIDEKGGGHKSPSTTIHYHPPPPPPHTAHPQFQFHISPAPCADLSSPKWKVDLDLLGY